ncbi:MAG: DUF6913 domain-containing protein [Bacteroidota bacterium]|jgi:hypothetical protein
MKAAQKIYHSLLLKRLLKQAAESKRKGILIGLKEAQSMAIVYDAGNTEAHKNVFAWAEQLRTVVPQVRVLGYFHEKQIPSGFQAKLHTDYFCRKNPPGVAAMLNTFSSQTFHLLINLCEESYLPVIQLLAKSAARCKVGTEGAAEMPLYDLLFSATPERPLYKQTDVLTKYLHMIHSKHENI